MPRRRSGHTTTVTIGAERFYLTANQRDDGRVSHGPSRWFGLVGPTTTVRPPRRARDTATATRLWAEAERLTGTALPAAACPRP